MRFQPREEDGDRAADHVGENVAAKAVAEKAAVERVLGRCDVDEVALQRAVERLIRQARVLRSHDVPWGRRVARGVEYAEAARNAEGVHGRGAGRSGRRCATAASHVDNGLP